MPNARFFMDATGRSHQPSIVSTKLPTDRIMAGCVASDMMVLAFPESLVAFQERNMLWEASLSLYGINAFQNGSIIGMDGTYGYILNGSTGKPLKIWNAEGASPPWITPFNTAIYISKNEIYHVSHTGDVLWTKPSQSNSMRKPVGTKNEFILSDSHSLFLYTYNGDVIREIELNGEVRSEIFSLDGTYVFCLVQDTGTYWHVFHQESGLNILHQAVLPSKGASFEGLLLIEDVPTHEGPDVWNPAIALIDHHEVRWRRSIGASAIRALAITQNIVLVAVGPQEYTPDTGIKNHVSTIIAFDYGGQELWRVNAPVSGPTYGQLFLTPTMMYWIVADYLVTLQLITYDLFDHEM